MLYENFKGLNASTLFVEVPGGWVYFKEMALRFADVGLEIIIVSPRATSNKRKEEVGEGVFIAPNCLFFDNKENDIR